MGVTVAAPEFNLWSQEGWEDKPITAQTGKAVGEAIKMLTDDGEAPTSDNPSKLALRYFKEATHSITAEGRREIDNVFGKHSESGDVVANASLKFIKVINDMQEKVEDEDNPQPLTGKRFVEMLKALKSFQANVSKSKEAAKQYTNPLKVGEVWRGWEQQLVKASGEPNAFAPLPRHTVATRRGVVGGAAAPPAALRDVSVYVSSSDMVARPPAVPRPEETKETPGRRPTAKELKAGYVGSDKALAQAKGPQPSGEVQYAEMGSPPSEKQTEEPVYENINPRPPPLPEGRPPGASHRPRQHNTTLNPNLGVERARQVRQSALLKQDPDYAPLSSQERPGRQPTPEEAWEPPGEYLGPKEAAGPRPPAPEVKLRQRDEPKGRRTSGGMEVMPVKDDPVGEKLITKAAVAAFGRRAGTASDIGGNDDVGKKAGEPPKPPERKSNPQVIADATRLHPARPGDPEAK